MKVTEIIERLAGRILAERSLELVDVEFKREGSRRVVRLFIDRPDGVGIDDCQWVSEQLSAVLDVEDPIPHRYVLEVSSPGVERPLKKSADFERFRGHKVRVKLFSGYQGSKVWSGTLLDRDDVELRLQTTEPGEVRIPVDLVSAVNLEFQFP